MRGKRLKQLRREFKERFGRAPNKSKWEEMGAIANDGKIVPAGFQVTRNEERIFRDLYRKARRDGQ